MKNEIGQAAVVFIAMGVTYAVLVVVAGGMADTFAKNRMVSTGSAILGGGLVFFLIRMFQLKK